MSSDFYFKTWITILQRLEALLSTDIEYQTEKVHDKQLSDAVFRLTMVLGQYMILYNEAVECLHNNLQVQKTEYMQNIVKAIVSRIFELKHELQNLECTHYQFFGEGLITYGQTTYDVEMTAIPTETKRSPHIQAAIENAFRKAEEAKKALLEPEETEKEEKHANVLDIGSRSDSKVSIAEKIEEDSISDETRVRRKHLAMIQAHEKLRQVTRSLTRNKLRRQAWEKELIGIAQPHARYELRVKSAKLLQRVFRVYFEIKRTRIVNIKLDRILGLNFCTPPKPDSFETETQRLTKRPELHDEYTRECTMKKDKFKAELTIRKGKGIAEDYRDRIREWFHVWFEAIQFIHGIPNPGCMAIFKEEIPEPYEWLQEYQAALKQNEDSKGKSPQQLKYEAKEKKRLEQKQKRDEQKQKIEEAALLMKIMKHPTMHPGYYYPQSKRTNDILVAIKYYHLVWDSYDKKEISEVKKKYINQLNIEDAYKQMKIEILNEVEGDMDAEHHKLKSALQKDYDNKEEEMPQQKTKRKRQNLKKVKAIPSEHITDKIEALAIQGWILNYPKTKLIDFIGDPNFIGENLRGLIMPASPYNYEVRVFWWEKCQAVARGCNKILLVGPDGSGKIKLVHALATVNDAVLFELDPVNVPVQFLNPESLKVLVKNIVSCAKSVQPSIVHIRHVQKLFYYKIPPEEAELQLDLIKKYFLQQLLKKIHRQDKITVIGTCSDPWLARSNQILKKLPEIILLPNTCYSLVIQLLKTWVMKHHSIPCNFNISSLARVLQDYSYGCLQDTLNKFMSNERIIKIAAYGISPMDVYNFFLEEEGAMKTEYDRYLKWYWSKTPAGRKEKQHMDDMLEYKDAVAELEAKEAKKAQIAKKAAAKGNET